MGYGRYDTEEELRVLNQLYSNLRLYVNFFQPVRKLIQKERMGSRIKKRYDVAQTPYRRALSSPLISDEVKVKLTILYDKLNPAELKREITRLQNGPYRLSALKQNIDREIDKSKKLRIFSIIFLPEASYSFRLDYYVRQQGISSFLILIVNHYI